MGLFRVRQPRVWIVCVFFCVLWLSDAHAQSSAQLSGSVLDATGLPLVGATVTLRGAVGTGHADKRRRAVRLPGPARGRVRTERLESTGSHQSGKPSSSWLGQRSTMSLTLTVALLEQTVVTAAKTGETDVQDDSDRGVGLDGRPSWRGCRITRSSTSPVARPASRSRRTPARSAHHPRDRHQCRLTGIRSEFGGVSRWCVSGPSGDGARGLSGGRSRRSASRSAGDALWPEQSRRRDQCDLEGSDGRRRGLGPRWLAGTTAIFPYRGARQRTHRS